MRRTVLDFIVRASNDNWELSETLLPLVPEVDYSDEFDRASEVTRVERKAA